MLLIGVKLAIFVLSNVGLWELLRRNTKIHVLFLPSLTIALQVTILFAAGLLNVLKEATLRMYTHRGAK